MRDIKILDYTFNVRSGTRVSFAKSADGAALISLPGCVEKFAVTEGYPVTIEICGLGPAGGPDVMVRMVATTYSKETK